MTTYPVRTRRWTRVEYDRLIDFGVLHEDEPVAFGADWVIRVQDPAALDDDSEPEPDVVVVPGQPRHHVDAHPVSPVLVVEVAESSLAFGRRHKGSLYARAGSPTTGCVCSNSLLPQTRNAGPSDAFGAIADAGGSSKGRRIRN